MANHQTVLILGAGSDMAKAMARNFAGHGMSLQLAGRNTDQLERLKKDLANRYSVEASVFPFDAADFDSHANFVRSLPVMPDIVVYAAGVMHEQKDAAAFWKMSRNMIDVNYSGAVSVLNQFAEIFGNREKGVIIGISSVAGDRGRGSNYLYGSTKAAFTAYLSGLRNDLFKKKVQVITVKPGFVYTKMTQHLDLPARLTADPEKVARTVYSALRKGTNVVYVKPVWRWIMQVIKFLPESVFKRTKL
jgi:short-subunit dehydrogenase